MRFRKDWWNHSKEPYFPYSNNWIEVVEFNKDRLALLKGIERATSNSATNPNPAKMRVLTEAKALSDEALILLSNNDLFEALDLQYRALEIASLVADVGIGITPGVGWVKAAYELISGTRLVDGKILSDSERLLAGVEVAMPGVGGLAVAGLKILSRNPIVRKGVSGTINQTGILANLISDLKPARFKEGSNGFMTMKS